MIVNKIFFKQEEAGNPNSGNNMPSAEDIALLTGQKTANSNSDDNEPPVSNDNDQFELDESGQPKLDVDGNKIQKQAQQQFTPSKDWDFIKGDDAEFKMPEGITAENEKDLLKAAISKKYDIKTDSPELHPLAKQIQDMATTNPNITIKDLVDTSNNEFIIIEKGMSLEDKLKMDFKMRYGVYDEEKNPDGLTDEDIDTQINKMNKVEKLERVADMEKRVDAYNQAKQQELFEKNKEVFENKYKDLVQNIEKEINTLSSQLTNVDNIYGIPVNSDEIKEYLDEFKRAVTPDKENNYSRVIDNILSNDMLLFKTFVLSLKGGEEKVIELITKGRESAKGEILKKLGLTATLGGHKEHRDSSMTFEQELKVLKGGK